MNDKSGRTTNLGVSVCVNRSSSCGGGKRTKREGRGGRTDLFGGGDVKEDGSILLASHQAFDCGLALGHQLAH